MQFTGERLITGVKGKIAIEHLHRYALTLSCVKGKDVLDIASGAGYGSNLMASVATRVTGVDISQEAIQHASTAYKRPNLVFKQGSATSIPLEENSVDIVVSFETIEHLTEHQEMINEIKRVLRPDGTLIISSPDKTFYTDVAGHKNDFHLRELTRYEFEKLIADNFRFCDFYLQGFVVGSVIYSPGVPAGIVQYNGDFEKINDATAVDHTYNLAVCSNSQLSIKLSNSIFNDEKLFNSIDEFYAAKIEAVYKSKSYRIGNLFVEIYWRVRSLFKGRDGDVQ